jgi:GH24 family phage-related lysozyme (muramidase)
MARPNRNSVGGLPASSSTGYEKTQATSVHAQSMRGGAVAADAGVNELAEALSAVQPGLTAFVRTREKEEAERQKALGMKARAEQRDEAAVLTPEQSPYFQQGYMLMHGQVSGADTARKMRGVFEENRNKPNWNPDGALREFMAREMEGMQDEDAIAGFLPHVVKERDSILNEWQKQQVEAVRTDTGMQLAARARDIAELPIREDEEGVRVDPAQTRHALYQKFIQDGMALGKTRPELAEVFTVSLINSALTSKDPRVLDMASIRDANGIALIDNPTFGKAILDARTKAEALEKSEMHESLTAARTDTLLGLDELVRSNPMDPRLDLDNLKLHAHEYGLFNDPDGKELAAYYEKVVDARSKGIGMDRIRLDLFGPNSRITAAQPEAKPVIKAEYGKVWEQWKANLAENDPNATARFIAENLARHQLWGVPDERLQALLTRVNTETLEDGKPAAEFLRAYQVYAAIKESPNADLLMDLTDERSRTMLRHFHEMILEGKPEAEAMKVAKGLMTPEAQERWKSLATPQTLQAFRADLSSKLQGGSWYTFGLAGRAGNHELFLSTMTNVFERKLKMLGNVEDATRQTLDSVTEYLAQDGNDNWTQRPDNNILRGRGQKDFENGLKAYTLDLATTLAEEDKTLGREERKFHLQRIGQGEAYLVVVNGVPQDRVELKEIIARGDAGNLSRGEAVTLSALAIRAKERNAPSLPGEELDLRWGEIMKLHQLGTIDSRVYESLSAKRRAWQKKRLLDGRSQATEARKSMLAGMEPHKILDEPGPLPEEAIVQPGGKNLKTADYAMQALKGGNLTFALTAQAEGFMTRVHDDPSRGRNIGLGFSVTSRSLPEVKSMLRRSGVPENQVEEVLKGKREVAPEVVVRLHAVAVGEYEKKAISALGGAEHWQRLNPEAKAVLTDMAWATGNPAQFKKVLEAMRAGDWKAASANLSLKYTARNGEVKDDIRRVNLWRVMLSGRNAFQQHLQKYTSK